MWVYPNLKAEMARIDIKYREFADLLGMTRQAISYKMNGIYKFKDEEMDLIQKTYFKDLDSYYLFKKECN